MKRIMMLTLIIALLGLALPLTQAQEPLVFDEPVTGEVTNQQFEVPYIFSAEAGEVIVAYLEKIDFDSGYDNPAIILLDASNSVLASLSSYYDMTFAYQLPEDGDYTLIVSRRDGRTGESEGGYVLLATRPEALSESLIEMTLSSEQAQYFTYTTSEPFSVNYSKIDGAFNPVVNVSAIIPMEGSLDYRGKLEGVETIAGSIGIMPEVAPTTYVVSVGLGGYDYFSDPVEMNFSLNISPLDVAPNVSDTEE